VAIESLQGELATTAAKLNSLYRRESFDADAGNEIPQVVEELRNLQAELEVAKQELQKLVVTAPVAGYVVPTPYLTEPKDPGRLPNWYGHPLEKRNEGSYLTTGTPVCQIVQDPHKFTAVLLVEEEAIEFVRPSQEVELFFRQVAGETVKAKVAQVSTVEMKSVPASVSSKHGGDVVTTRDEEGRDVPRTSMFQVSVPFEDNQQGIIIGATGQAKISAGSRTIGQRCWRFFCRTFNFEL